MKIFHKLLLLLVAVAIVPLTLAATGLIWRSAADQRDILERIGATWGKTTRTGEEALSAQTWQAHVRLAENKALELETTLETMRRAVQLQSRLARQALERAPDKDAPPAYEAGEAADLYQRVDSDFSYRVHGKTPYVIYHLSPGATPEATKPALDRLRSLGVVFHHYQQGLPWIKSAYVWEKSGLLVGYPGGKPFPKDYDPKTRYWFLKAVQKRRVIWTKMYSDKDGGITMTYADPLLMQGRAMPEAVAGIDIRVNELLDKLFDLGDLSVADALIMDYKGRVRASASYGGQEKKLHLEHLLADKPPNVDEPLYGAFKPVSDAINKDPKKLSGVVEPPGEFAYAYARVRVHMRDDNGMDWYYVVKVARDPALRSVGEMRAAFGGLQRELRAGIDAQARKRGLQLIALIALAALAASVLAYAGARFSADRLTRIAAAVGRIAKGDLSVRLDVDSKDELGQVQAAVNDLAAGLNTFKRYVAPSVVDRLLKDPNTAALSGERRRMTVFFSDLAGFTTLAEKLKPEALVEIINEYLSAMTLCIFSHEGTLDKYEGDAIVAFWGAPIEQPDHAKRACLAAIDGFRALQATSVKLSMRVGINTGPMVVGNMGSMAKMEYTVLGDEVNVGSRLEGANRAYGTRVLIGEQTWRDAKDAIEAREVDLLAVKGRAEARRVYELLGRKGEVPALTLSARDCFEEGLSAYRARKWDEAEKLFRRADSMLSGDPVSRLFLDRVAALRKAPPSPDWRGEFVLTEK